MKTWDLNCLKTITVGILEAYKLANMGTDLLFYCFHECTENWLFIAIFQNEVYFSKQMIVLMLDIFVFVHFLKGLWVLNVLSWLDVQKNHVLGHIFYLTHLSENPWFNCTNPLLDWERKGTTGVFLDGLGGFWFSVCKPIYVKVVVPFVSVFV